MSQPSLYKEKADAVRLENISYPDGNNEISIFQPESRLATYIPGGYSQSRCLNLSGRSMMYAVLALAGAAIMFFGFDATIMSQVNTNPDYLRLMHANSGSDRDSAAIGGIVSVWFGGFAIGAILVGTYADRIGRLKTMQVGALWAMLGAALQASAQNITWMMFARVIGGIGCGHLNTVVPIWTSELADPHVRGAFVAVEFTLAIGGSVFVYWMEYACVKLQSEVFAWRFPLAFQAIFLVFILGMAPFMPESPRHLAKQGKIDEARDLLWRCRVNPDAEKIEQEMRGILEALRLEANSTAQSFYTMITTKDSLHTRRRIFLGCGIQIMQKLTGIDFIATYAPEMFSLSGYKGDKPTLLAGGNFISYMASLALAIWLCDRFGRRKLMMTGCTLMGLVLVTGAILSAEVVKSNKDDPAKANRLGAGVATVLYAFTAIYGSTWLTTCWVYPVELFPLATRARGTALATIAFSIAGGVINEIVPYLLTAIGYWTLVLFAALNFVMLVPIYLFYIETANRDLEVMDLLFSTDSVLAWRAERDYQIIKSREAAGSEIVKEDQA